MAHRTSRSSAPARSRCPISCSLDLLGDRWTLLVIRDLIRGLSRYGEFAQSPEGIPTNILADRLAKLESWGIIESKRYQDNPPRYAYTLTPKGRDLRKVLSALGQWALKHVPRTEASAETLAALREP